MEKIKEIIEKKQKCYKILDMDGHSCNGGGSKWFLPRKQKNGNWKPGKWMEKIRGELILCQNGYHLCREEGLLYWLGDTIYEAEYKGIILKSDDKVVVRQARLVRKCENWNPQTARLFACWCVRNTPLENGGRVWDLLTDNRSKNAVKIADQFANGKATKGELTAAWDAAWDAAWGAAADAARGAAMDAARDAAGDAAWDAARGAAGAAAWAAAKDAARDAAWAAAKDAQIKELLRILNEVRK